MALHLAAFLVLVVAFLCYRYMLYPAFLSPLAKIPTAHPIASVLPVWLWWTGRNNRQAGSLLAAHQRKGPVVRVEPNHVHVASLDGVRVVFNVGCFPRSNWYLAFRNYNGTPNLVTVLEPNAHAARRRVLAPVFSKSYIIRSADFHKLSHVVLFDRLLPVFDEAAESGHGVDVFEMAFALSVEFMSAYQYGIGNSTDIIRKGTERERKAYLETSRTKVLELKGYKEAAKVLEDHNLDMCTKAEDFLRSTKEKESNIHDESASTYPVEYARLTDYKAEGPKPRQETIHHAASEMLDNLEAARIGIGGVLTYILHELTTHPAILSDLRRELTAVGPLLSHPPARDGAISAAMLRKLDSLPLLDAVITETLRLRNPVLTPARRVVPHGGAVVDGFFLPAGTEISVSTHTLHMNPDVFPEPRKWLPSRWIGLPSDKAAAGAGDQGEAEKGRALNDPRRWLWSFISGSTMCVGNNFVMMGKSTVPVQRADANVVAVLKLVVAGIYTNYTTSIIDDEGIEQLDRLAATPAGEKLILGFSRLPKA
jgi:cytochrome P450